MNTDPWSNKSDYRIMLEPIDDSSVLHAIEVLAASLLASVLVAVTLL